VDFTGFFFQQHRLGLLSDWETFAASTGNVGMTAAYECEYVLTLSILNGIHKNSMTAGLTEYSVKLRYPLRSPGKPSIPNHEMSKN